MGKRMWQGDEEVWLRKEISCQGLPRLVAIVSSVASEAERVNRYMCLEENELHLESGNGKLCEKYSWGKKNLNNNLLLQQNLKRAENKQSSLNATGTRHSWHLGE